MAHRRHSVVQVSRSYKRYLLGVLLLLQMFNFMDRYALGVVLEDIKVDLGLSDTQLGFMSGLAFAFFYSLMGVPIARWADRGDRVRIMSVCAGLWSIAVAACGFATTFVQLLLVRVGVAVGEAGGYVPAFSLLADYFNRGERPRAMSIFGLGACLSLVFGYLLSGWLNELYGWRIMFVLLGLPGVVLAALTWLTIKEPRTLAVTARAEDQPSIQQVGRVLWTNTTFRHLLLSISIQFFFLNGALQWQPTFFNRSFGLTSAQIGGWFAVIYGLGSILGTYAGGALASRHAAHDERLQLKVVAMVMAAAPVLGIWIYLSSNLYLTFALMGLFMFSQAICNGPLFATVQTLIPERMRAVAIAITLMFGNLIGLGLGPLAVGVVSDALRPWAGSESLRYALIVMSPGLFGVAWHVFLASRSVERDLRVSTEMRYS